MSLPGTDALAVARCSRCGVREAVYLRASSGEALCSRCLWDEVLALASRALSRVTPSPTSRFLVPISSFAPSASLVAAAALSVVERRFRSKVIVGLPSFYDPEVAGPLSARHNLEVQVFEVTPGPPEQAELISCIRYDRAWALRAAESVGADVIVLPLTRTDLTMALLEALLSGPKEGAFDGQPSYIVRGVKVLNLFHLVEREAMAALEYLEGYHVEPACRPRVVTKGVMMSIAGAPERDYGGVSLSVELASLLKAPGTCVACGAPSKGSLCDSCQSMGLDHLSVGPSRRGLGGLPTSLKEGP